MSKLLMVVGALITVLGVVLVPLPGPGYLVLTVGATLLVAGFLTRPSSTRGSG